MDDARPRAPAPRAMAGCCLSIMWREKCKYEGLAYFRIPPSRRWDFRLGSFVWGGGDGGGGTFAL